MNYSEAMAALEGALRFGIDPSLESIRRMCAAMGEPQDAYGCIQVAGTNGKSSVTRMTVAMLRGCGHKVGLYTSPELVRYPERIEIDGAVVSDQMFANAIEAALGAAAACRLEATEFELLTAGALWLFAREGVDVAVLECGLGGRWDATSVCRPAVAVITGIGLDHTHILGNTLEEIAGEKAAIIKSGCKAVVAPGIAARPVFDAQIAAVGAEEVPVEVGLEELLALGVEHMPAYQRQNAAVAFSAAKAFEPGVAVDIAIEALRALQIPGRFETLRADPLLIIDAAHNPQSAQALADELHRRFRARGGQPCGKPIVPALLLGILADKDAAGIVETLVPLFNRIVVTKSQSPRALEVDELTALVEECTQSHRTCALPDAVVERAASIEDALSLLSDDATIATGSITVAGEVKALLTPNSPKGDSPLLGH